MKSRRPTRRSRKRLRVLLVDDQAMTLEALQLYFSSCTDFDVSGVTVEELHGICRLKRTPDVVVVNLQMLETDAVKCAKRILTMLPRAQVIGFRGLNDRKAVLAMIRAGARGYLLNTCSPRELFHAIETVSNGSVYISAAILKLLEREEADRPVTPLPKHSVELRESERKILALIADGLSNKEIAGKLSMSVRTIEKYRELLTAKLQIKSIAQLTKFAIRSGLSSLD